MERSGARRELARAQFAKGADVVFAAAGGTGMGVYQAAKDSKKFAVGVDSNQNHIQPGTMLTSMVKRVEVAVYEAAKNHKPGWSPGAEGGRCRLRVDQYNEKLIAPDVKKKVDQAKADIIAGKIKVNDFMSDPAACGK
jgi:basic membrane protein A